MLVVFAGGGMAACGTSPAPTVTDAQLSTDCRRVQHLEGETQVCGQPETVAVLGAAPLEMLVVLDTQPAGFADHTIWHRDHYDNPSQQIPYLGRFVTSQPVNLGSVSQPSIEAIVGLQPDLIVGTGGNVAQYKTLSAIAPTILVSANDDDSDTSLRTVAQALDRTDPVEQIITEKQQQVIAAREVFAPVVAEHPNLLVLGAVQWKELYLGDRDYGLCSALLEDMGFQLVIPRGLESDVPNAPIPISHETLSQLNDADSVILFTGNLDEFTSQDQFDEHQTSHIRQAWEKNAIAQSLDASKAGRVYFIPGYLCRGLPGAIGTELYLKELKKQLLSTN
ncbi:MAG: iron-siderophore ABC transporter substrate-binding protein [Cyanobacteria bacterium P01_F01_bin.86]